MGDAPGRCSTSWCNTVRRTHKHTLTNPHTHTHKQTQLTQSSNSIPHARRSTVLYTNHKSLAPRAGSREMMTTSTMNAGCPFICCTSARPRSAPASECGYVRVCVYSRGDATHRADRFDGFGTRLGVMLLLPLLLPVGV